MDEDAPTIGDDLRASEQRYRRLVEFAPVGIYVHDGVTILYCNAAFAAILRADGPSAVVGRPFASLLHPDERAPVERRVEHIKHGATSNPIFKGRINRDDGSLVDVEVLPTKCSFGGREAIQVVCIDVSERVTTQRALEESGARYRALVEGLPDAIYRVRRDLRVIDYRVPARSPLVLPGTQELNLLADLLPAFVFDGLLGPIQRGFAGEQRVILDVHGVLAGTPRAFEAYLTRSGADEVTVLLRDVTELRALQDRIRDTERLASLGTLVAGVAHEMNNPLAFVLANTAHARERIAALGRQEAGLSVAGRAAVAELETMLAESAEGAWRVERIVRDLRTFSRFDEGSVAPVDLRRVVDGAINLVRAQLRGRTRVETTFEAVPSVSGDESALGQVVLNLLVNAIQAIAPGREDAHLVSVRVAAHGDGQALIEVRDTGAGIAPNVLSRIFDPFFSTKPVGEGTGLGLAICHGILRRHGGEISVESQVGVGSTFRITLPASLAAAPAAAPVQSPELPHARILIIDDEVLMGTALARRLAESHSVELVCSGAEALAMLERGERFDAIVCDLMMPGMTGWALHGRLSERYPEQARVMVFMTAGAYVDEARRFLERTAAPVLLKPYTVKELDDALQKVLQLQRP